MRKITKRVVSLLSVLTVGGGIVGNTLLSFPEPDKSYTVKAETANTTVSSMLEYDDSKLTVAEDQSAYVVPAMVNTDKVGDGSGDNAARAWMTLLDNDQTDSYEQHVQLDEGKSGLLVQSKQAGDAADGTSFTFKSKMKGDFEIDFRVFSEHTYQGGTSHAWGAYTAATMTSANGNSFLDLRRVSFKLTSASDPTQSVTIFVNGESDYDLTSTRMWAVVNDETFNNSNNYNQGYALKQSDQNKLADRWETGLKGTSFSNANKWEVDTASNYFKVDMDEMQVIARDNHWGVGSYEVLEGAEYKQTEYLIRDLDDNTFKDGTPISGSGIGALNKADFADGYYVTVTFEDVTSTSTPVVKKNSSGTVVETIDETPERIAKMLIYSVNGQSLRQYEDWNVTESTYTYSATGNNSLYAGQTAKVYTYTSEATGTQAEGNYITLSDEQVSKFTDENDAFNLSFGTDWVKEEQNHKIYNMISSLHGGKNKNSNACRGFGARVIEADAYSDVRTMGVTVRSKTDPTKAFTLYVDSFGSPEGSGRGLVARVAVEGEAYRNNDNRMGFGCGTYYKENTRVWDYADVNGSFGGTNLLNKKSGNQGADPYVKMRFKPDTMEVQVRYDGQWHTVRTLSGTSKEVFGSSITMNRQAKYYNNLQAVDFAGGYTVEVALVHMNTNDNKGLELMCALENGSVTTEAIASNASKQATYNTGDYERPGVIKIVEYKENDGTQQSLSSADITAPKATANGYNVAWNYEEITGLVEAMDFNTNGDNTVGIKFETVSLFGKTATANKDVNVTYVCDTDSSIAGTITKTDANGVAGFNATRPGMYKMTYNDVTYTTAVNSDNQFYVYYDADVTDGEDDYKSYYVGFDTQVKFADLAPKGLKAGETLVGYTIEGQEGIYALDYVYTIPTTFENGAEKSIRVNPVIVDFAAATGASVRIATDGTSGLRFRAYMSKAVYEALGDSASFSVAMAMENGAYGAMKAIDAKNIFEENRNGADIYSMTAAIYNVEKVGTGLTQNFKAKFVMTITYVGGETATFEVETGLKNLKDVATALKADAEYETLSLAQQAIVDGFAGV